MPRRVLVTGAGGFVGANLVRRLAPEDDVHAVVRPAGSRWRLEDVDAEVHEVDLLDDAALGRLLGDVRPDVVFHLAAHGAYSWQEDVRAILATNAISTALLLEAAAAAGVASFVQAGSSSEYGFQDHPPAEHERPRPNSAYAVGKVAGTLYGQIVAARTDMRVVTLRLYSAYGPWEEPRRLVPTLLEHALRGTLPPLTSPDTARDFVFAGDVCEAFVRAAGHPGGVFNVCTGRQVTLREIVDAVRGLLGVEAEAQWGTMDDRAWDTSVWVGDPALAASELGWRAQTPLRDGLARTAEWMRRQGAVGP